MKNFCKQGGFLKNLQIIEKYQQKDILLFNKNFIFALNKTE